MRRGLRLVLLAVPLVWVAIAHIGPLIAMARISVTDVYPGPPGHVPAFSTAAYASFGDHGGYRASLLHSLGLASAATFAALLLCYPLAYQVALRVAPSRQASRLMLLVAPFWTGEVLRMFALVLLLANRGAVNAALRWAGVTDAPPHLLYGSGAVLAGTVYTVLPCMLLPLSAALNRLPTDLLDAASTLGAASWSRFWHVTLPLTAGGVATGAALTFLASLGLMAAPALLGGAGVPVFATTIADLFGAASFRWPQGAAFGFILLLAGTACAAALAASPRLLARRV